MANHNTEIAWCCPPAGTQIPDDGEEADKLDEAICPTDMNCIADDDLRLIFGPLDPRVKLTVIGE